MTDLDKSVIESLKNFLLPELRKLQDGQNELKIRLGSVEKQVVFMNENISNNTIRIDGLNRRIDDLCKRLDGVNDKFDNKFEEVKKRIDEVSYRLDNKFDSMAVRVDNIMFDIGNIKKEMERLKGDEFITGDILHRMEILEGKVLLGQ